MCNYKLTPKRQILPRQNIYVHAVGLRYASLRQHRLGAVRSAHKIRVLLELSIKICAHENYSAVRPHLVVCQLCRSLEYSFIRPERIVRAMRTRNIHFQQSMLVYFGEHLLIYLPFQRETCRHRHFRVGVIPSVYAEREGSVHAQFKLLSKVIQFGRSSVSVFALSCVISHRDRRHRVDVHRLSSCEVVI